MRFAEIPGALTGSVNNIFGKKEPWQIAAITATTFLTITWLLEVINCDEDIISRIRKRFFKLARKLPPVKQKIQEELNKVKNDFEAEAIKTSNGVKYITKLPDKGKNKAEILDILEQYLALGDFKWKEGHVSGAVYYYDEELVDFVGKVYSKTSYSNPLHADVFPGVCKMEAEVVRMAVNLFNGGPNSCGTMTTGGTESIIMACKAYRDYALENKGITRPNIVAPITAHAAFDKAAQFLGIFVKSIKIDPDTTEVDLKAMKRAIDKNTIMLVGSAPNFPYGTMDDISKIGQLGKKYNIPVHVDACLGGFVIVFMNKAGYIIRPFDFTVEGVTSISADTHKYGFSPKGSSIILYSDPKYRKCQYTVTTDWPGGVYGSPSVNGSRAGGLIAVCWATMLSFGFDGYIQATKKIITTTRYIEESLRTINEIFIFGKPATTVIAVGSKKFDIFRLSDLLLKCGWNLNVLQFPCGFHICITYMHTKEGIADKFLEDIKNSIKEIMKNPQEPVEGKMAIYGVSQSIPDRSIVGDFTRYYLDSKLYTPLD